MVTTIHRLQENHLGLDTNALALSQSLQQGIGLVKLYGQGQVVRLKVLQKIDKENISIFV